MDNISGLIILNIIAFLSLKIQHLGVALSETK